MNVENSSGPELLPQKFPPPEALGSDRESYKAFRERLEEYSDFEQRAILWTVALQNAVESEGIERSIPGLERVSYGFGDPDFEEDAFGVIVYRAASTAGQDEATLIEEPETSVIKIANLVFPVFTRSAVWDFHAMNVHPANGTAACWAKSKKNSLKRKAGLVTAKHVVGQHVLGNAVPLTKGYGTLIDLAPEGIDAALVQVPKSVFPHETVPLACETFIAQWTDVQVIGRVSGVFQTKIVEVTSSRGSLHYSIPLRVFLAMPGQPGDSGSLVISDKGLGIGIYMGSVTNIANQQLEGFCQHLGQAADTLSLDLMF